MTTVTINDPARATEAGTWAVENIGYKHWQLQIANFGTKAPRYEFKFDRKKDAVWFSLKWL
jgi:hypothetical protein